MFLLVPAHPGFPGQIPQSRKTVVCVLCDQNEDQILFRIFAFYTCFHTSISQIQFRILYVDRYRTFAFSHFALYTCPSTHTHTHRTDSQCKEAKPQISPHSDITSVQKPLNSFSPGDYLVPEKNEKRILILIKQTKHHNFLVYKQTSNFLFVKEIPK